MKARFRSMTVALMCGFSLLGSSAVYAASAPAKSPEVKPRVVFFPSRGSSGRFPASATDGPLLSYHGGSTITFAKVVLIFWGPSFSNPSSPDYAYAQALIAFRNHFGTSPEYKVIKEYSGIRKSSLDSGTPDWFDPSTPPTNVTDSDAQGEVNRYLASNVYDASTIYEVFLPSTSYSSFNSRTSCGTPNLNKYCAYHSWIGTDPMAIKYSVHPFPSCSDCQYEGWTPAQNQEHAVAHETREAVTDPTGFGWYSAAGGEADDYCEWSPPPFIGSGGFSYQFEWSNAASGCVSSTTAGPAPTVAPVLTVTPDGCNNYIVSWTIPAGTTAFELWQLDSSTFASSKILYSGASDFSPLAVTANTYVQVRACNLNGCSPYSNVGLATFSTIICP